MPFWVFYELFSNIDNDEKEKTVGKVLCVIHYRLLLE